MQEMIIPLNWEFLDPLLDNIDSELTQDRFPTVLRRRAQLVVEELFRALMDADGAAQGRLRFLRTDRQSFVLQYRNAQGPLAPPSAMLYALQGSAAIYGVKMQLLEGSCTVTVGVK